MSDEEGDNSKTARQKPREARAMWMRGRERRLREAVRS